MSEADAEQTRASRGPGVGAGSGEKVPRQLSLASVEPFQLTKQQYAYAVTRGRLPATIPDWQCKLIAEGWDEAAFKGISRRQSKDLAAITSRWNAIPAVQAQIEYERAIAMETRLAEPLRAWEARMERLMAMAAGELPQRRTVDTGAARWVEVEGLQSKIPNRVLAVEEFYETNLTALAKALEMQGRALSVFKDRQELSGPDGTAAIQVLFVPPGQGQGQGNGQELTPATHGPAELTRQEGDDTILGHG